MTFAWEGICFQHPDDWAPVTLTGDRREGYARLDSGLKTACQLRWKSSRVEADLNKRLDEYIARIRSDATKAKRSIEVHRFDHPRGIEYHYTGAASGRGLLIRDPDSARTVFLEVTGTRNDRLAGPFRMVVDSLEFGRTRWAVLGLDVSLPSPVKIQKKTFLAGKTELKLSTRGVEIEAQRWGFAEQLIERHGIENWARAALDLPRAEAIPGDEGVELIAEGGVVLPTTFALAKIQPERNQISTLRIRTRKPEWRPSWDWLN